MKKKMSNRLKLILSGAVIVAIAVAFVAVSIFADANSVTNDLDKMLQKAEKFHDKGDWNNAVYQLELYCQQKPQDTNAAIKLADWYNEKSGMEVAMKYYRTAEDNLRYNKNQLAGNYSVKNIGKYYKDFSFTIKPGAKFTQNMKLTFTGENLVPNISETGAIDNVKQELTDDDKYITTAWFPVDSSKKSLIMAGGFNCAVWQYKDKDGNIINYSKEKGSIKKAESASFDNKVYVKSKIPLNAVECRVTYVDNNISDSTTLTDNLTILYGNIYSGYTDFEQTTYEIPDITGEQYIEYKSGKWTLYDNGKKQSLKLGKVAIDKNTVASISGDLCGIVTFSGKTTKVSNAKSNQYGIKFSLSDGNSMCQRIGDAKGMKFNYTIDNEWVNKGANDFDNAYPWCEMKLCNVTTDKDSRQKITYEGEEGFSLDGKNGNVMVEIPKFYTKREVKDGYEYIWISGEEHDGYILDPIFQSATHEDGLDKIYVGAYLSCMKSGKAVSYADQYPTINKSTESILSTATSAGNGYSEISYLAYSALQKLFIIETGTIDSSAIFSGDSNNLYYYPTTRYSSTAIVSKGLSNSIVIKYNSNTASLCVGDSIAVLDGNWNNYLSDVSQQREIKKIDTDKENKKITVTFDGKPLSIVANRTTLTNIPRKTGKTNNIKYCTGTENNGDGKNSFKYRGIENIYSSSLVLLDGAYVKGSTFYYTLKKENIKTNINLPDQTNELFASGSSLNLSVAKNMSYDSSNPTIMFPSVLGDGATSLTYYGDYFYYNPNEQATRYICAGGAFDNQRLGGIFQLRATHYMEGLKTFLGGRLMYR